RGLRVSRPGRRRENHHAEDARGSDPTDGGDLYRLRQNLRPTPALDIEPNGRVDRIPFLLRPFDRPGKPAHHPTPEGASGEECLRSAAGGPPGKAPAQKSGSILPGHETAPGTRHGLDLLSETADTG